MTPDFLRVSTAVEQEHWDSTLSDMVCSTALFYARFTLGLMDPPVKTFER